MEQHTVKGKTYPGSQFVKCSVCGTEVTRQGLGSHMRLKHQIRVPNKKKPLESAVETSLWLDPFAAPRDLAEFLLKLFKGDDKKLIKTIREVKKEQDEEE